MRAGVRGAFAGRAAGTPLLRAPQLDASEDGWAQAVDARVNKVRDLQRSPERDCDLGGACGGLCKERRTKVCGFSTKCSMRPSASLKTTTPYLDGSATCVTIMVPSFPWRR